jgi:hypothetical protein
MARAGYSQLLNWGAPWQTTQGASLTTAVTATISPQTTGAKDFAISPSALYVGLVIRCTATGILTTTGTSTTATIFLTAGVTPTTLVTPSGITTGTTVVTGIQWWWESLSTVTAIASSGNTFDTIGRLLLATLTTPALPGAPQALTAAGMVTLPAPNSAGDTAAAIDTTSSMAIMLRGTLAGANATVQCNKFLVEAVEG